MNELLKKIENFGKTNATARALQTAIIVAGIVAVASFGIDLNIGV